MGFVFSDTKGRGAGMVQCYKKDSRGRGAEMVQCYKKDSTSKKQSLIRELTSVNYHFLKSLGYNVRKKA